MEDYIYSLIEKIKQGMNVEGTNIDLKRQWWDISSQELEEFLKDICAFANTHTGESIIVLGLDETTGDLYNSPLPTDEANIQAKHKDKINPKINVEFSELTVDDHIISLIKIPHSSNRPHVIRKFKNYDNYIPIRFGTSTIIASRSDLDEMYKERNEIKKPNLEVTMFTNQIRWEHYAEYKEYSFLALLTLYNSGNETEYIKNVEFVEESGDRWKSSHFKFENASLDFPLEIPAKKLFKRVPVYMSDEVPDSNPTKRPMPDIDRAGCKLVITTISGNDVVVKIKPAWFS